MLLESAPAGISASAVSRRLDCDLQSPLCSPDADMRQPNQDASSAIPNSGRLRCGINAMHDFHVVLYGLLQRSVIPVASTVNAIRRSQRGKQRPLHFRTLTMGSLCGF